MDRNAGTVVGAASLRMHLGAGADRAFSIGCSAHVYMAVARSAKLSREKLDQLRKVLHEPAYYPLTTGELSGKPQLHAVGG